MFTRTLKSIFLLLLIITFVVFAVSNREFVSLSLFPLSYTVEMPKFIMAILCFALGAISGWAVLSLRIGKQYFQLKSEQKRTRALQNEVSALHTEKQAHMPALPSDL